MFTYEEGNLHSTDGTKLFYRQWEPDDPKAVLLFVHGVGEHSGRYLHVGEYFAQRGFACYAHDYRGSGQSEGKRGYINCYEEYRDDFRALMELARQRQPGKKLFAVGHSQGGTIVLSYALDHPKAFDGVIVSSPALGVILEDMPIWKAWLANYLTPLLSRIAPGFALDNEINPCYLSRDPSVGEAYAIDPLVHDQAVMRWYVEYRRTQEDILSRASEFHVPCLIMQAGDDHLAPRKKTEEFYGQLTLSDKRLIVYEGFYHELFNEVEKERVFKDMEEWLAPRVAEGR